MTTLQFVDPKLVIALDRKILFINPNDLQIFKEIELPNNLTNCGLKAVTNNDQEDDGSVENKQASNKSQTDPPIIQNVRLSNDRQLLAVTTSNQKAVLIYKCYEVAVKLLSIRPLARTSSAIAFNENNTKLFVSDKSGDCYEYDCLDIETNESGPSPKLLLGHLSIVYDILYSQNGKYLITCDRDDKIRVTNYPKTYDIHSYCLGHKEFVAGILQLDEQIIASVSGDKTLKIWNFETGEEITSIDLPAPGIRLAARRKNNELSYQIGVLLYQPNECVALYEVIKKPEDIWEINKNSILTFPQLNASNLCFANDRLYVAGTIDNCFALQAVPVDEKAKEVPDNWLQMVNTQFRECKWNQDDISLMFKKRFDNVSEYMERKKKRIEEKQKK